MSGFAGCPVFPDKYNPRVYLEVLKELLWSLGKRPKKPTPVLNGVQRFPALVRKIALPGIPGGHVYL